MYVSGYQTFWELIENLSPLAHLNVWADQLAKNELH